MSKEPKLMEYKFILKKLNTNYKKYSHVRKKLDHLIITFQN